MQNNATPENPRPPSVESPGRYWVIGLGLSVTLLATAQFASSTWTDYRETLDHGWLVAERTVRVLDEQVGRSFDASNLLTARVADISRDRGADYLATSEGWDELRTLADVVPHIGSVFVFDAQANLVATSLDPHPPKMSFADRPHLQAIMTGAPFAAGALRFDVLSRAWFFSFNHPIHEGGVLAAIVRTAMHADYFRNFYEDQKLGPSATISLYRDDGAVLMRWPLVEADAGASVADSELYRRELSVKEAGRVEVTGVDGAPLLKAYRRLKNVPVIATAAVSREHVLQPFRARLYRNGTLFSLSLALISGLLAVALSAMRRESRARQASIEQAQRLRVATEAADLGVFECDHSRGCGHWANARMFEIFGRSQQEGPLTFAQMIDRLVHAEDVPVLKAALERARQPGAGFHAAVRIHHGKDRTERWIEFNGEVQFAADGTATTLVGTVADITDRKTAERLLRDSEQRYRLLTEQAADGIFVIDSRGILLEVNSAGCDLVGYTREEMLERSVAAFIDAQDVHRIEAQLDRLAKGHVGRDQWRFRRKDGSFFIGEVAARQLPNGDVQGIVRDITARQEAEEVLRGAILRFEVARKASGLGVFDHDLRSGYLDWDDRVREIWGIDTDAQVDYTAFIAGLHPEDREATEEAIRRSLDPVGSGEQAVEFRVINRCDGAVRWIASTGQVLFERAEPVRVVGTVIDITERRKSEITLAELNAKLEERAQASARQIAHLQKTEALGRLTGGVAHDFNNLLMAVQINLDVLKKRLPASDVQCTRLIENAVEGIRRGATLTQRMLAFARRQDLEPEPISLPKLVTGMSDLLSRTLGPQIRIETRFAIGTPKALADANQLELAVLNLAVNARDAMPEGGTLVIVVDTEDVPAGSTLRPGRYVALRVSDTGTGMDAETLSKAMEPFFTTKGAGKGTGLGLSMVHGLAEQSGGRFSLSSELGRGTVAEILLPVAEAEPAPALPHEPQREPDQTDTAAGLKILVVDDDRLVLAGIVALLQAHGHCVTAASSGQQGLEILRASEAIDVVVTDHGMPGMTGLQLAQAIRSERPGLPVILVTGYAELPRDSEVVFAARLSKPFAPAELLSAIARATRAPASLLL